MTRRRLEAPPESHPLPQVYAPGGWIWSPEAGDYVRAEAPALAALPPASPEPQEVITDGSI